MNKKIIARIVLKTAGALDNPLVYAALRFLTAKKLYKVMVHLGTACNYRCRYCYIQNGQGIPEPRLTQNDWFAVLQKAKRFGVKNISILGGEPFCEPYLEEFLARIKELGMRAYLYTNGSLVTDEWVGKLARYGTVMVFKYDADDQTYRYHTQQAAYSLSDIEDRITKCVSAGVRVVALTTVMKRNVSSLESIFARLVHLGAFPAFERYLPVADARINESLEVSDEEFDSAMGKVAARFAKVHREWVAAVRIAGRGCGCYHRLLSISSSGEVLPCPYLPDAASLGNIKEKELSEVYAVLAEKKKKEFKADASCTACRYRYECGGGCYTYAYLKTGRYARHCLKNGSIGFCSYLLESMYDTADILKSS